MFSMTARGHIARFTLITALAFLLLASAGDFTGVANAGDEACAELRFSQQKKCRDKLESLEDTFTRVQLFIAALAGMLLIIIIAAVGLQFMMSQGNPQAVEAAKSALKYAVVGFALAVLAEILSFFVQGAVGTVSGSSGAGAGMPITLPWIG